jgi:SAM-dependent methyltransferase
MCVMPEHGDAGALAWRRRISRAHYATLGELFDPTTFRHLGALGLRAGWRCWEVGAGGPTVPAGLAERVGPTGRVLATDIDVSALEEAPGPGFEILRHGVTAEPAPRSGLDLVHARLVLMHVAGRDAALTAMTGALRPGGWLLAEEADLSLQPLACPDEAGPAERLQQTMIERQRDRLLAAGLVTAAEIDQHLADIAAGRLDLTTFTVVSAWGRKPP